ncbi:MAG: hypothetical protein AB4426_08225 [Xenococcaceae cyanobacterium]
MPLINSTNIKLNFNTELFSQADNHKSLLSLIVKDQIECACARDAILVWLRLKELAYSTGQRKNLFYEASELTTP